MPVTLDPSASEYGTADTCLPFTATVPALMVTALRSLEVGYSTERPLLPSVRFTTKSLKSAIRTSHCGTNTVLKSLVPNAVTYSFVLIVVLPRNEMHVFLFSSSHGFEP